MPSSARAFVIRHTTLRPVPALPRIRLHLADEILPLWRATQLETRDPEAPLPYWAFAWAGGLALASYLRDHPAVVAGRRVLDFGAGSGIVALAAARAGAAELTASDVDPFAVAAIGLNARANGIRIHALRRDLLDDPPPTADVVLAADCWYEAGFAARVLPWLERARDAGSDVLVGDPGRRYLPVDALEPVASYWVRTTTELEDLDQKRATVYRLRPGDAASSRPSERARAIA